MMKMEKWKKWIFVGQYFAIVMEYLKMHFCIIQHTNLLPLSRKCSCLHMLINKQYHNLNCGQLSSGKVIVSQMIVISKFQVRRMKLFSFAVASSFAFHSVSVSRFREEICFTKRARDDFSRREFLSIQNDSLLFANSSRWIHDKANMPIIAIPVLCKKVSRF